jgi:hypothetical protein
LEKNKAITVTACKMATLFYKTLPHGMAYTDPGARNYEDRYRQRVLSNLQRRAKSRGFVLREMEPDAQTQLKSLFLMKLSAVFNDGVVEDRQMLVRDIEQACADGARLALA